MELLEGEEEELRLARKTTNCKTIILKEKALKKKEFETRYTNVKDKEYLTFEDYERHQKSRTQVRVALGRKQKVGIQPQLKDERALDEERVE